MKPVAQAQYRDGDQRLARIHNVRYARWHQGERKHREERAAEEERGRHQQLVEAFYIDESWL